jgi:hypothetical protein
MKNTTNPNKSNYNDFPRMERRKRYPESSKALLFAIEDRWGNLDKDDEEDSGDMITLDYNMVR